MIEFILEGIIALITGIGIAIWLGFFTYAISKGWHKAKAEFPTTINTFTNPTK